MEGWELGYDTNEHHCQVQAERLLPEVCAVSRQQEEDDRHGGEKLAVVRGICALINLRDQRDMRESRYAPGQ